MPKTKISKKRSNAIPKSALDALKGLGKEVWRALGGADRYIKEERASWQK